jgi:hypothetical protein
MGSARSGAGLIPLVLALPLGMLSYGCASLGSYPPPTAEKVESSRAGGNISMPMDSCMTDQCHVDIRSIKEPHAPVRERLCGACHIQRATDHPIRAGKEFGPSRSTLEETCFSCHEVLAKELSKATVLHAPVARGTCQVCHAPHGTDLPMLFPIFVLVNEWEPPYGPPHVDSVNLCWQCHDRNMIVESRATGVTQFRNRERNLHYLHVAKPKNRGCRVCHETHAGRQAALFRDATPFGTAGWKLPLTLIVTRDGGTCVVGCHKPRSYEREPAIPAHP